MQELNNRLENVTQENKDLLHKVSSLEETVSSADSESKTIQQRVNALTEERNAIENEVTSLRESLQTLETEKQVCCFLIALRVVNLYLFCLVYLILYSLVFFSLDTLVILRSSQFFSILPLNNLSLFRTNIFVEKRPRIFSS